MSEALPTPDVVEGAYENILQYGAIGGMLVLVIVACFILMRYVLRSTKDQLDKKDKQLDAKDVLLVDKDRYIADIQDKRVSSAEDTIRVMTTVGNQMGRLLTMSNSILRALEQHAKPSDSTRIMRAGGSDDATDDQ